jgi:hypothetical protein
VRVDSASEDTHEAQHHDSHGDAVDESGKLAVTTVAVTSRGSRGPGICRSPARWKISPERCASCSTHLTRPPVRRSRCRVVCSW